MPQLIQLKLPDNPMEQHYSRLKWFSEEDLLPYSVNPTTAEKTAGKTYPKEDDINHVANAEIRTTFAKVLKQAITIKYRNLNKKYIINIPIYDFLIFKRKI